MQGNVSHNAETLSYGSCASSTSSPRPPSKFIQSHAPIALKILCHVQLAVVCDSLQHLPQRQKASEIPGSSLCATNNLVQAFFGTSEVRLKALVLKPRWLSSSADGHDSSMHCKLSASSGYLARSFATLTGSTHTRRPNTDGGMAFTADWAAQSTRASRPSTHQVKLIRHSAFLRHLHPKLHDQVWRNDIGSERASGLGQQRHGGPDVKRARDSWPSCLRGSRLCILGPGWEAVSFHWTATAWCLAI